MRSEKELWELVLSRTDLFETGLCHWVFTMRLEVVINIGEFWLLKEGLDSLPKDREFGFYCWPPFKIEPRIEWIKNRIKQLEDENKS